MDPRRYLYQRFGETELVCYRPLGMPNFAIMIPENKVNATNLRENMENYIKNCETCQKRKLQGRGHGCLAPREALVTPWYKIRYDRTMGNRTPKQRNEEISCTNYDHCGNKLVEMQ